MWQQKKCFLKRGLSYDPEEKNVDNINTASNLFTLYDLTGKEKYRRAIESRAVSVL
jgi:rhamnogalacturonyl hydrolase YesR